MIEVDKLRKMFVVHKKAPGLMGSVRSLFVREKIEKHAVREMSFRVGEGEIVGLIGANGAGKTTLVKMLAGIIHPSGGSAKVLGYTPWERDDRFRSRIALIMGQKAQLWWDLPAADCFLLLKEIYRIPEDQFRRTLDYLVEVLSVGKELNVQIRRLSLGERMKMELIAALLHSPRVVYLDEPTIGLDVGAQRAIREFILKYQSEQSPAMLLTSHYMEDIERLCKRIIILREGELVYDGGLAQVVQQFARHKIITVHLAEGTDVGAHLEAMNKIGEVKESDATSVKLHVPRASVASAAAAMMQLVPVSDLTIEEEEITRIIENIIGAERK